MAASSSPRRRGRAAVLDPETLLDRVHAVVHAGAAAGMWRLPMAAFNRLRADVDRAAGVDPAGSYRTPTAEGIKLRFEQLAGRAVSWEELLDGARRTGRERTMWLAALRREEPREVLTHEMVAHALRFVAARRGADALGADEYIQTREELVAADRVRFGDDSLLDRLLPTGNQVLAYCGGDWNAATRLAGLEKRRIPVRGGSTTRTGQPAKTLSFPEAIAFYGALNGTWPSYSVLLAFERSCNFALADVPPGGMAPLREQAAALLRAEGVTPPTGASRLGRGKRLSYRYPVNGIPGAPPRVSNSVKLPDDVAARRDELRRGLAVISLRVWLAELAANDKRTQAQYRRWQVGSQWPAASTLGRLGGFSALKAEAEQANQEARRQTGNPLPPEVLARADAIRAEMVQVAGGAPVQPVPFGEALRAVLAGPHAEVVAPMQSKPRAG